MTAGVQGHRLKMIRKSRGLSAESLSRRVNGILTRSVIANLENGRKADLTVSELLAVAGALGVAAYEIAPELDPARSKRDTALQSLADELNGVLK